MQYFKVKNTADQVKADVKYRRNTLIGGELYTASEMFRYTVTPLFIARHFDIVEIPKKQTFFCFGSRRQKTTKL